jgi:geranylgeranyl pyrophosphate synthase
MDDDDLRRGRPTCHRAYDEATAILVGDALQALAFAVLANEPMAGSTPQVRLEMIRVLGERAAVLAQLAHFIVDRES